MSSKLNLSSNPFRNRFLPWTITALVAVLSISALLLIARSTFQTNAKILAVEHNVAELRKQTETLTQQAKAVDAALTPDQKRELKYAHALVDRKSFSWSRLFVDLEASLPGEIRVTRIAVKSVGIQGDRPAADLDLVVASKSAATVTQMIEDMEAGGIFHAELVSQNPQRGRNEVGSEFELNVHYVPRAGYAIEPSAARRVDTAGEGGQTQ